MPATRGKGRARLGGVHPLRQRQCMTHMLCQICGTETLGEDGGERQLFLLRGDTPITEGERTGSPPVHRSCAAESVRDCPHLREGHVAALVEWTLPWGVAGLVYDRAPLGPRYSEAADGLTLVGYEDPRARWTLALRDVQALHGCTPVSLDGLTPSTAPPSARRGIR